MEYLSLNLQKPGHNKYEGDRKQTFYPVFIGWHYMYVAITNIVLPLTDG